MNIHAIGAALTNRMRPSIASHDGHLRRGTGADATETEPICAASPPIGQRVLTNTGLDLSEHDRVLFFKASLLGTFGLPRKGDIWVDHSDGSEWRLLPDGRNEFWRWHGQTRDMIQINCKLDNLPNG